MVVDPAFLEGAQIAGAGGAGGALRAFLSPDLPMRKSIATTLFGTLMAYNFAPIIVDMLAIQPHHSALTAVGFLIGLLGFSVASALLNLNWRDIVLRFLPSGNVGKGD